MKLRRKSGCTGKFSLIHLFQQTRAIKLSCPLISDTSKVFDGNIIVPYSIYWSGSPECRPYARIISTKIVAFLLPSSINFIIHESNHHLPRTVMVPTYVKITTNANDISWTFYLSPWWMSELVLWSLLRVFITTSRYYNRFICFHFDWSCYHPLSYSIDLFKYHVYYWYFWYDIWRTASR